LSPNTGDPARRAFRAVFYVGGAVATAAGFHAVAAGARAIPGRSTAADPGTESELRFYAAFYAAYGAAMLRTAPRADRDDRAVRALAASLFLAGLARAEAWRSTGEPDGVQKALLAVELAGPPAILAWRSRLGPYPSG
jgi:Domain of unknown function (DUF4345)